MMFKQLFDPVSSTYSYLIAADSGETVLIPTVYEQIGRDLALLGEHNLKLVWVLDTHVHADHVTGANALKAATGAESAVGDDCRPAASTISSTTATKSASATR